MAPPGAIIFYISLENRIPGIQVFRLTDLLVVRGLRLVSIVFLSTEIYKLMGNYFLAAVMLCISISSVSAQQKKGVSGKGDKGQVKRAPIDTTRFALVEGGSFTMGTDKFVEAIENPPHSVTVKSFWLAKTEMTFEDYDKFCNETKRDTMGSAGWGRGKQPAIWVSWNDAVAYCNWLSVKEKLSKCYFIDSTGAVTYLDTAKGYRLPTEAEWEFAARGGNKGQGHTYAGSDNIGDVAWYNANSEGKAHPVAQKAPNELGLYDMDGNVWEWLWDIFDGSYYIHSPSENPEGPASGPYRVMRGGAFYNNSNYARVFTRQNSYVVFRQNSVGFRIARTFY